MSDVTSKRYRNIEAHGLISGFRYFALSPNEFFGPSCSYIRIYRIFLNTKPSFYYFSTGFIQGQLPDFTQTSTRNHIAISGDFGLITLRCVLQNEVTVASLG